MFITEVSVDSYRNIEKAKLELDRGVNVFYGKNAQGKTNLLESIYFFACGKSFRGAKDSELIKLGAQSGSVTLNFTDQTRERTHKVTFFEGERKICFKEGIKISRISDFIGVFRAVLFSPEHLSIIKDGPSERRNFCDIAISQIYPSYMAALSKYKKMLVSRNTLLKDPHSEGFYDLVSVISDQMAQQAAFISSYRARYIERLSAHVQKIIHDMSGGKEDARISYDGLLTEEQYLSRFTRNIEKELMAKTTLYGIQKDDITVTMNGLDSRVYCSQGQQRSLALAMKLAEGEISRELCGEYPVFLFDDILSELDESRKDFIMSGLSGRQVIITGCDKIRQGKIFSISDGKVSSFS